MHTLEADPETEKNAPWGLARISHRNTLSFGTFNKYLYSAGGGEGVDVYVIDTGTNVDHVDFEGRASWGKTIPTGDADEDGNGHGTHCSGTVAGKKYGVAKKANVIAVKFGLVAALSKQRPSPGAQVDSPCWSFEVSFRHEDL